MALGKDTKIIKQGVDKIIDILEGGGGSKSNHIEKVFAIIDEEPIDVTNELQISVGEVFGTMFSFKNGYIEADGVAIVSEYNKPSDIEAKAIAMTRGNGLLFVPYCEFNGEKGVAYLVTQGRK